MKVSGVLVFTSAVLVYSILCARVRELPPSGELAEVPGFRFFRADSDDIPGAHTKMPNRRPVPVLGPIRVLANGNYIYAWDEDNCVRLIYDSRGKIQVINILTGRMEPMTPAHDEIALPLADLMRARTNALVQERDRINSNIAALQRNMLLAFQNRNIRN